MKEELKQMDQRTRKLMMMLKALHIRDDSDILYVSKKGGRDLTCTEDRIDSAIRGLKEYIKKSKERQQPVTSITQDQTVNPQNLEDKSGKKNNCVNISSDNWLRKVNIKRKTESFNSSTK